MAIDELDVVSDKIARRFERINAYYIKKLAEQIRQIGEISPSNFKRLKVMAQTNANIAQINKMLEDELMITTQELFDIYSASAEGVYKAVADMYSMKGIAQPTLAQNKPLQDMIKAISNVAAGTLSNISHTTAINRNYTEVIDSAVQSIVSGGESYNEVVKGDIKKLANQGIRIRYMNASGRPLTRRLDSAIRMNISDGISRVTEETRRITGEQFGANGVEVSAHMLCAEDHLPYQGLIFTYEQFDNVQASLRRRITTCNCKHITYPVDTRYAKPTYTDAQLNYFKMNSQKPITLANGKQVSKYDASQLMRQLETKIRYAKEEVLYAEGVQNQDLIASTRIKVENYTKAYYDLADRSGLKPNIDRLYVPYYRTKSIPPNRISAKQERISQK